MAKVTRKKKRTGQQPVRGMMLVKLTEGVYSALRKRAEKKGLTPNQYLAHLLRVG